MSEDPTGALQDLRHCRPIPIKKSLVIVNNFVVNTTRFLNRFSAIVDEKLLKVSNNLSRLETTLSILEAKLDSVPDLDGSAQSAPANTTATNSNSNGAATTAAPAQETKTAPAPPGPDPNALKVKDDPQYARYFKLMKLGMPVEQIKLKLSAETDLDPNLLDTPDAISPNNPGGGGGGGQPQPETNSNNNDSSEQQPVLELENGTTEEEKAGEEEAAVLTIKDDPAFAKYFKMLKLGLPPSVVKHKMTMEGFDPDLIDKPNDPSPNAGGLVVTEE